MATSIFVNPTQFGPGEDFSRYPRPFERDLEILEHERVDLLFHPSIEEMYPDGASTLVEVAALSGCLDEASRPHHFRGVATVVSKLFNIIQPDAAYFGQKDAAQCAVIRRMTRDLHFDLQIRICPTVRETDGLAVSSRNTYLSAEERREATVLYRSLVRVSGLYARGVRESRELAEAGKAVLTANGKVRLDYFEIVDPSTLEPVVNTGDGRPALVAVAAFLGSTRLIDNVLLGVGPGD